MLRYGRDRYLVFGVLQALTASGLLLYGLHLATRGSGGSGDALPLLLVVAGLCLLTAAVASVKRGRDLGLAPWITVLLVVVGLGTGPLFLLLVAYLALARGQSGSNALGPPAPPMGLLAWGWGLMALIYPWVLVLLLGRIG